MASRRARERQEAIDAKHYPERGRTSATRTKKNYRSGTTSLSRYTHCNEPR